MSSRHATDQQVRLYMKFRTQFTQRIAAAKAGFSERTARRIDRSTAELPSQRKKEPRTWRTRRDPLEGLWASTIVPMLEASPGLMAVTIFEELQERLGDETVPDSIRRTLERRVRHWNALHGPGQEVFFPQNHPAGERGLSDFTDAGELGVTIAGDLLPHRFYHFRLACSGWEHAEVVLGGESFTALATGLQNALWSVGGVPHEHRTDSLSAAFHNLTADQQADLTKRYEALCQHYGMEPTRNNRGEANENGTIEAANGHLKRRVSQALKRRGSCDFETLDAYRKFVAALMDRYNRRRHKQVQAEAAELRPLPERRTTDFIETSATVTSNATISVDKVTYSVPDCLIGEKLHIHLTDDRLHAYLGPTLVFDTTRIRANRPHRSHVIDYRHVINALRRKPQAFRNYVFRDDLFPREEYRRAWNALDAALPPRNACKTIVGLLDLAARHACEADLANHLAELLDQDRLPDLDIIRARFAPPAPAADAVKSVVVATPDIAGYDALLPRYSTTAQAMGLSS